MAIKKFFRTMLAAALLCVLPSVAFANPRVVFIGDSITYLWNSNIPTFFQTNNFLCKGVGGNTTGDMLKRFTKDVINNHPQVVVILAGTNDVAQADGVFVTADQISSNIFHMAKMAQEAGIKVVLCSIFPSSRVSVERTNLIPTVNTIIEEWAANNNCEYVDYYSLFVQANGALDPKFSADDCHLNAAPAGYFIMEQVLMPVLERMLQ